MDYTFPPVATSAIVTGGASGIGKEISLALASRGIRVAVCDINASSAEATARELPDGCRGYALDLGDAQSVEGCLAQVLRDFGGVGILINSAGIVVDKTLDETTLADWERTLRVNLTSCFLSSQIMAQHMRKAGGGRIVNIASEVAHIAFPNRAAYMASKSGLIGFTKALALEVALFGIRANTVSPTVVMTEMGKTVWTGEKGRAFLERIPVRRFAEPEDVAAVVCFLCSAGADMLTGIDILVDGGNAFR